MQLAFILIFGILLFVVFTFLRRWNDVFFLISFAIGAAVNANIYNSVLYPVKVGELNFSLSAFLYVLFILTVMIRLMQYGIADATNMTISTLVAITISAFIQFFAEIAFHHPFNKLLFTDILVNLLLYLVSVIGTFLGTWVMVLIYKKLKEKNLNQYLILFICMSVACTINALIYSGGVVLFSTFKDSLVDFRENFLNYLLGGIILRVFALGLSVLSLLINNTLWKSANIKNNIKESIENN